MLKPILLIFSAFASIMVLHLSINTEPYPNVATRYDYTSKNWMILKSMPDYSEEDAVQMRMTTPLPTQIGRNIKLSAEFLKKFYTKQAEQRANQLKTINQRSKYATLYNVLVPEVYCPDLVRVGNVDDGGKWVCNPAAMPQDNCSIYSLGLRNEISFDSDIQEFNNFTCKLYGYDAIQPLVNTVEGYKKINGEAQQMKITDKTNLTARQSTIEDLLRSHHDNYTEILKIDIEGAEYSTLPRFLDTFEVCHIFLELHGQSVQMRDLLVKIARKGYYLYFYEVNGDSLAACEFSFINQNCMERYGTFLLAPYLKDSSPYPPPPPTTLKPKEQPSITGSSRQFGASSPFGPTGLFNTSRLIG